jgi:hypothetical protein
MKKTLFVIFTLMFLVFAMSGAAPVYADGHGHGHGGHVSGGIWIGPGWWGPWWGPWWGWGPGYPYPYYQSTPMVIQQQPPIYEEQAPQEEQQYYWYFCPGAKNYYPYVKQCPEGWMKVVPPQQTPPR